MKSSYLTWTCIGLFFRLLIMPFSFHGHDIFYIYYFPYQFLKYGQWDPYLYFPELHLSHYPPIMYLIFTPFLFLIKPFLPHLSELFSTFETWNFAQLGNTVHFADILMPHQLFRTLFLFKLPYLFFDFAIVFFLVRFFKENQKKICAYKLWMLNPFTLHGCYALGQADLIITFFLVASVYSLYVSMPIKALLFIPFSSLIKTFSLPVLPFAILSQSTKLKDIIMLSLPPLLLLFAFIFPYYLSSGNAIFKALFFSVSATPPYKMFFFLSIYSLLLIFFFFYRRKQQASLNVIIYSFILPLLCFFIYYKVTLRYFILTTPFLIYLSLTHKRFWLYTLISTLALFELKIGGNDLQWGLFAALHPEWTSSLPILDSFLNLVLNMKILHQILNWTFVLTGTFMIMEIVNTIRKSCYSLQNSIQHPYA